MPSVRHVQRLRIGREGAPGMIRPGAPSYLLNRLKLGEATVAENVNRMLAAGELSEEEGEPEK